MTVTAFIAECPRCNGIGKLPHFSHIANGDCFLCGATGQIDLRDAVLNERSEVIVGIQVNKNAKGKAGWGIIRAVKTHNPAAWRQGDLVDAEAVWTVEITDLNLLRQLWAAWKGTAAMLEVWQQNENGPGRRVVYQG
jgi:hypothetical protein